MSFRSFSLLGSSRIFFSINTSFGAFSELLVSFCGALGKLSVGLISRLLK